MVKVKAAAPDYGPEGGTVSGMNEEEMRDHVEMLLNRMQGVDFEKKHTAGVAMALYIGDQTFLPEEMDAHPAAELAKVLMKPKTHRDVLLNTVRALVTMGPHAGPHASAALAKMLGSSDFELKWETIRAIRAVGPGAAEGNSGVPEGLARVIREEETPMLRYEASRALESLGPGAAPGAAAMLAQAMEEEDIDVQNTSAKALAVMGPAAAFPPVIEALVKATRQGSFELKRLAVDALAAMGTAAAETAPVLARLLRPTPAGDPVVRVKAAQALGKMGRELIRQEQLWLSYAVADPDELVREAARATLRIARCKRALKGSMYLQDPETDEEEDGSALAALGGAAASGEQKTLAALEVARESGKLDSRRDARASSNSSRSSSRSTPDSLVAP